MPWPATELNWFYPLRFLPELKLEASWKQNRIKYQNADPDPDPDPNSYCHHYHFHQPTDI